MAVTPTGILSEPATDLARLFSESEAWQVWLGLDPDDVDAVEDALARVFILRDDIANLTRPFIVIDFADDDESLAVAGGANTVWKQVGSLLFLVEADIDEDNIGARADEEFEFRNNLGAVIADLWALAGVNDRMMIRRIGFEFGPLRSDPAEVDGGNYIQALLRVEWGLRP